MLYRPDMLIDKKWFEGLPSKDRSRFFKFISRVKSECAFVDMSGAKFSSPQVEPAIEAHKISTDENQMSFADVMEA